MISKGIERLLFKGSFVKQAARGIYIKDPLLDKSKYKPDDKEYQHQYLSNHIESDPRLMNDPNVKDASEEVQA